MQLVITIIKYSDQDVVVTNEMLREQLPNWCRGLAPVLFAEGTHLGSLTLRRVARNDQQCDSAKSLMT
jgi:hypothetical protein